VNTRTVMQELARSWLLGRSSRCHDGN